MFNFYIIQYTGIISENVSDIFTVVITMGLGFASILYGSYMVFNAIRNNIKYRKTKT